MILPALAVLWCWFRWPRREAFVYVYLPTVLCLPGWCRWVLPGLPDPTFNEAAILPIAAAFFLKPGRHWQWSVLDFQVGLLLFLMGLSEMQNAGFADAQNLMFDMVAAALLPYLLAKGIVQTTELRIAFARVFVLCLVVVFTGTIYEARFAFNPYRAMFAPLFPEQGRGWVTTFRYGLARVAGPYGHAILAGIVFLIGLQLHWWLKNSGYWEEAKFFLPIPIRKATVFTATTLGGLVLTMVRGPQVGALLAWLMMRLGRGPNPRRRFLFGLGSLLVVGLPVFFWFLSYASVGRAGAASASQETAAYRKELIDKYVQIAWNHALLGWGRNNWPRVPNMPSIDNYYLLLALMHGVVAAALLVSILLALMVRLFRNGIQYAPLLAPGCSLSFALCGVFVGVTFAIATVYIGENVLPIFFMMIGFAEGYLLSGGDSSLQIKAEVTPVLAVAAPFSFRRTIS